MSLLTPSARQCQKVEIAPPADRVPSDPFDTNKLTLEAAFAKPEIYEALEDRSLKYASRIAEA